MRQYDMLEDMVQIGLCKGIEAFDKYMLWTLNHAAVANMMQHGGRYREEPVYVGKHIPPRYDLVPGLMDRFFSFIHENWERETHPTAIAAYALWKINWIHPFNDGNGRTARASCYYLICMKYGGMLPGRKTVPDRIREDPAPYYQALAVADRAWEDGHYGLDDLADYLQDLLTDQLREL